MAEQFAEPNVFMLCDQVDKTAFRDMPKEFRTRLCRPDELGIWKQMPFDDAETAVQYQYFMDGFFDTVYAPKGNKFFETCLFVVDENDVPVGTCFAWKSYDMITTMGWYKVKQAYEGKGIGRALLTEVMRSLSPEDYPLLLHTQPSSARAIKLYSDFGFKLITDAMVGRRTNDVETYLPILKDTMPEHDFERLRFTNAPKAMLDFLSKQMVDEF